MIALLIKLFLPILLKELVSAGAMTEIEAAGIKTIGDFILWVKDLKVYYAPADFPNSPPDPTPNNLVVGQVPDDGYPKPRN